MALTPEQQKTIRLARVMSKQMLENQLLPALKEFAEWQREQLDRAPAWARPKPPTEPQEDPAEQQRLLEVLAAASKKETK